MSTKTKYKDQELAEKLYPIFLEHGTAQAVYDHCVANSIKLTKPTLSKMSRHFGWKEKRDAEIKTTFATPTSTGNLLVNQLVEIEARKTEFRRVLEQTPLHEKANELLGKYLKIELDVIKEINRSDQKEEAIEAVDEAVKQKGLSPEFAEALKASLRQKS